MKEIWKDIQGYEGLYQVSNLGRVKSLEKYVVQSKRTFKTKEKIMKKVYNKQGYVYVKLCKFGEQKGFLIHRLVAQAFIPNIENKSSINHKNGKHDENNVDNLEWVTYKENNVHAIKNGFRHKKRKAICVAQIKDNEIIKIFSSIHKAGKETGINHRLIYDVAVKGLYVRAGGYEWKLI